MYVFCIRSVSPPNCNYHYQYLSIYICHSLFVCVLSKLATNQKYFLSLFLPLFLAGWVCGQKEYDKRRKRRIKKKKKSLFVLCWVYIEFFFEVLFEVFQVIICKMMINENEKKLKENEKQGNVRGGEREKSVQSC